jgi:hypothetical protein
LNERLGGGVRHLEADEAGDTEAAVTYEDNQRCIDVIKEPEFW